jgi:hypothetical protein
MFDALTHLQTKSFHTLREIGDHASHLYIGDTWVPQTDIFLLGATMGLLCFTTNRVELYLSISKDASLEDKDYFVCLKKNFMFYSQRDQRQPPQGVQDLTKEVWVPTGTGFYVGPNEPVFFKCGAMNKSGRTIYYDIFATVYYVELMSTANKGAPLEDHEKRKIR